MTNIKPTRVFVDMSLVDYKTHITGIPRVAYAYLEEGYEIGRKEGFEVIPVYVRDLKVIDARPFLVTSNWRRFKTSINPSSTWHLAKSLLYFILHGIRIMGVSLLVPLFVLLEKLFTYQFFDFWRERLKNVFQRIYFILKDTINNTLASPIPVRPGDVLFMPAYWHDTPSGFYARLKEQGVALCPMVHDILPITHAEHYYSPWREMFAAYVFELLRISDYVFYISEYTRDAVFTMNEMRLSVPLPPGSVIHHGFDFGGGKSANPVSPDRQSIAHLVDPSRPYFLMVGSIEPKKNHIHVLAEFERLWLQNENVSLVVVGRIGWKDGEIRSALRNNPHLHSSLRWLERANDKDLRALYAHAAGLIQASEAEGFGLPIIEALALGAPVLANDIPVFREVGGKAATYFDIDELGDLGDKVLDFARREKEPRAAFVWPTWEDRAQQLYKVLLTQRKSHQQATAPRPVSVIENV